MKFLRFLLTFLWYNREAVIWISALVLLALNDPGTHHYSLCPFDNAGWKICPGCGLGRSISMFFHGGIKSSLQMHPLGIPAVILLVYRSVRLIFRKENIKSLTKYLNYG